MRWLIVGWPVTVLLSAALGVLLYGADAWAAFQGPVYLALGWYAALLLLPALTRAAAEPRRQPMARATSREPELVALTAYGVPIICSCGSELWVKPSSRSARLEDINCRRCGRPHLQNPTPTPAELH